MTHEKNRDGMPTDRALDEVADREYIRSRLIWGKPFLIERNKINVSRENPAIFHHPEFYFRAPCLAISTSERDAPSLPSEITGGFLMTIREAGMVKDLEDLFLEACERIEREHARKKRKEAIEILVRSVRPNWGGRAKPAWTRRIRNLKKEV